MSVLVPPRALLPPASPTVSWWHALRRLGWVLFFGSSLVRAQLTPAVDATALQPGAISGLVRHSFSGRPVWGVDVRVPDAAATVATDANGRFELRGIPPGACAVSVAGRGLVPLRIVDVVVRPGETTELGPIDVQLAPSDDGVQPLEELVVNASLLTSGRAAAVGDIPVQLSQIVVTPSRFGIATERGAASVTLTRRELSNLPQLGEDLYRTIARLPGLAVDDLSAGFWVRGAPNSQVLARLDGMDLIEPFHLKDFGGVLSVVDLETIGSIDLVSGGFTAEYGDRLAGVLTMETQQVPRGQPRTTLGLSFTNVRATRQGEFANGDGQWMIAARRGYLDLALRLSRVPEEFSPEYYDFSGKIVRRLSPQHTVSWHFLHAGDRLRSNEDENAIRFHSTHASTYTWGRWQGAFGDRLSGEAVLSFAQLEWQRGGTAFFYALNPLNLSDWRRLDVTALRQDWTLGLTDRLQLRGGADARWGDARYRYFRSFSIYNIREGHWVRDNRDAAYLLSRDGESLGAYAAVRAQPFDALVIEPGVRFEQHDYTHESGWMPRFNAALSLGPRTALRGAFGRYRQAPGLQDLALADGDVEFHPSSRAEHRIIGLSHRLRSGVNLRVEAYERLSTRLPPRYLNPVSPVDLFYEVRYDRTRVAPSEGRARGIELVAEHRSGRRFGWSASYSFARAEERIGDRWVPVDRDQTHTFYMDFSYVPAPNWQLGLSWQYHTGWPNTPLLYQEVPLNGDRAWVTRVGAYNADRLSAYHRLDLRATRRYPLRRGELRVYVDIFNAYSRYNQSGVNYTASANNAGLTVKTTPDHLIPILPTAGISWEF